MEVRLSANNCLAEMGIPQVPWASRIPIEMPILMKWELFAWESTDRTHTFNGPLSGTTQVSQYQKGKTNLDFTEARDSECRWHQLGHMQACTSL